MLHLIYLFIIVLPFMALLIGQLREMTGNGMRKGGMT